MLLLLAGALDAPGGQARVSVPALVDVLLGELTRYKSKFEQAFNRLMGLLRTSILQDEQEAPIIVQGAAKLLGRFEAFDTGRIAELFRNIEEKAHLAKLLSDVITFDRVRVLIGVEANLPAIADCSLVVSSYGDRNQILGSVGILGPKRIPYDKIIPLVDHVARKLSQTICQDT